MSRTTWATSRVDNRQRLETSNTLSNKRLVTAVSNSADALALLMECSRVPKDRTCRSGRSIPPDSGHSGVAGAGTIILSGSCSSGGVAPMTEPSLTTNLKHWRDRAEEARSVAEMLHDADAKRLMLVIAESYGRRYEQQSASIWPRNHGTR